MDKRQKVQTKIRHYAQIQKVLSWGGGGGGSGRKVLPTYFSNQLSKQSGQLSAHQQNAILMVFCWWAHDGPTLNARWGAL